MLTRADYGLAVCGSVDQVSEVQHRQGTAKNGNPYSFFQQTVSLATGGNMYEVHYRADVDPRGPLVSFELDQVVKIKVGNPRVFNGSCSFDAL